MGIRNSEIWLFDDVSKININVYQIWNIFSDKFFLNVLYHRNNFKQQSRNLLTFSILWWNVDSDLRIAPSSSKFNPKRRRKDINFRWLFHVFLGFRNLKTQGKVIESWCLFGLNFEDEGANYHIFRIIIICLRLLH